MNDIEENRKKAKKYYQDASYPESIKYAEQWLVSAKGDKKEEVAAYDILANACYNTRDYEKSIEYGNHELRIAIEVEDKELEAQARAILSFSYYRVEKYKQSIEHCEQILGIPEGNKQRKWDVQAFDNLALSSYMLQNDVKDPDYNESIKYGELHLKAAKELGDRKGEEKAYLNLINSYTKSGDMKKADEYSQLHRRTVQDQSQSKAAAAEGSPNYSSESPQDGEHEKELAERGLTERSNSGDFKEIEEGETDEAQGKLPNGSSSESPQDGEHEKERSNSGDFQEINEGETNEARERLPNGSSSVPRKIEACGPGAKVASENDLKTEKVKLYRARIILISQDQAGKTSLKKSLFGLPFESEEESTEGVKVDPTLFEVEVKQVKNWPLSADARIAAEQVQEEEPKEIKMNAGPTREEKTESVTPELNIDPAREEVTDVLVQYLKGVNFESDATSVENHITLDVWDFVGQHLYYAIYPVFLSPKAVYMLICNLSKDLKATATPFVRKEVIENKVQNENSETNLENLLSWLTSVSTFCPTKTDVTKKLDYLRPPIFIVGTHADKPHQDIEEMKKQIKRKIFGKEFSKHVIRPFVSVDNTQGSSCKGLAELRDQMIKVLKQEPYMGEEVPLRWLKFEKIVQALVAKKVYYLKLEQLQTIIQKVCVIEDKNEVDNILGFYHDLGMIVKLCNTVVLQAQWLIGVFKQLIAICDYDEMKPIHEELWKDLQEWGVLSMELVDHVFSEHCPIKEDILNMMERFGLIAKFATSPTDENYFVPCQLKTPPDDVVALEPSPSDPFSLYLRFEFGFVPHGFFPQLVSEFTRSYSKSGFSERFTLSPYFYDKASKFVIKKTFQHHLVMLCTEGLIKIVLKQEKQDCSESSAEIEEVANTVRQSLEDAMQSLTPELPWLKDLKCDWSAACSKKDLNDCPCLHTILEGGKLKSRKTCQSNEKLTLPRLEKWFSMKAIVPSTTEASPPTATLTNAASRRPGTAPAATSKLSTGTSQQPAVRPGFRPGTKYIYKMTASPRGLAIIVNNKKFENHPDVSERPKTRHGSQEDVRQVEELFTDLGFTVETEENLKKEDLLDKVYGFANKAERAHDCFVLWLMSHGSSGKLTCAEGKTVSIQSLQDQVIKAVKLEGKPKLFFIQSCRGYDKHQISLPKQQSTVRHTKSTTDTDTSALQKPSSADFLFSYSTVDDYVSHRDLITGSYFVTALVEVFRQYAAVDDLDSMLIKVNDKVSEMVIQEDESGDKCFKQMPQFTNTLTKKLYF